MYSKFKHFLILGLLLSVISGCNLPSQTTITPQSTARPAAPTATGMAASTASTQTSSPTSTLSPSATPGQPAATPNIAFDANANAYRIRFAPNATWVEIDDTIAAGATRRYVLAAMQGQVMSVSIPQGPPFTLSVAGADKKLLGDARTAYSFWRGALPAAQDYFVTVQSQVAGPFTLRVAINPPGQAAQNFDFADSSYRVALSYSDDFAPTRTEIPVDPKGAPLLTLAFIDSAFFAPTTNLSEAYLILTATRDPAIVATCTQPSANRAETVTGTVPVNQTPFTRAEFNGVAAGNLYAQTTYRAVMTDRCFEVIFLFHSGNIGNYPPGTVVEFDRAALLKKFEAVLTTFVVK